MDWSAGAVRLLTEPVPWPAGGRPRRAGVSAFGISGTNAHVILEDPPRRRRRTTGRRRTRRGAGAGAGAAVPWLVSARTAAGLAAQAGRLAAHLAARPELDPADVAWSLATTRSVFEHRAVVTGARPGGAGGRAGRGGGRAARAPGVVTGAAAGDGGPGRCSCSPARAVSGRGWAGSWRRPRRCSRRGWPSAARALAPYVDWSLAEVLAGATGAPGLDRVDVVQPALWAVMVSLAAVWQAAGVVPDAVAGHSQGEIAAACVAGILSLEDAARVVALRSRALAALAGRGGMVSVAEPAGRCGTAGAVGRAAVGGGGERPGGHGGLRGPGGAGRAGGACARRGGAGPGAAGGLRLARPAGGGASARRSWRAGRDHPGPGADRRWSRR